MTHRVTLSVGNVFVTGQGPSPQAARHHAASLALEQLRKETLTSKAQLDGKFFINIKGLIVPNKGYLFHRSCVNHGSRHGL